jgi:membrane protein required for colicin V production
MEPYDLVMLAVAIGATLFGFMKGFAWQVASLASLVVSYFVALKFADQVAPLISDNPQWNKYAAMLVIYAGTSLAVWMLFRGVSGSIDRMKLREFDRQMGGLLGLAKGVLLCTVVTFFAVTLTEQSRAAVLRSKSGVYISEFLHKADPIMPPELKAYLGKYLAQLQQGLNPTQAIDPAVPSGAVDQLRNLQPGNLQPQYQPPQYPQPGYSPQSYPPGYQPQYPPGYPSGGATYAPGGNYVPPGVYGPGGNPYAPQPASQPTYQPVR